MSEEEKAIKRLEEMTKNYSLNSEDLHYAIILYYLIINLQKENKRYKEVIDKAVEYIKYCQTSDDDIFPVIEAEKMIEILKGVE